VRPRGRGEVLQTGDQSTHAEPVSPASTVVITTIAPSCAAPASPFLDSAIGCIDSDLQPAYDGFGVALHHTFDVRAAPMALMAAPRDGEIGDFARKTPCVSGGYRSACA
jgi:hypothetical protein